MLIGSSTRLLKFIVLSLILTVVIPGVLAAEEPLAVTVPDSGYDVLITGDYARQFIDEDADMSAAEVWKLDLWEPVEEVPSFGYTNSVIWFRIRVVGPGSGNLWLTEHHGIDRLEIWEQTGTGTKFIGGTGWLNPEAATGLTRVRAISAVSLPSSLERTYLIRMSSSSSLSPRMILMGDDAYLRSLAVMAIVQGFSIALTVIFLVFGLIIFFKSPDPEVGAFIGLVPGIGLLTFYVTGLGPLVLWSSRPVFGQIVSLSSGPFYLFVTLVFLWVLYRHNTRSWLTRSLKGLAIYIFVIWVVTYLVPTGPGFQIMNILTITVVLALEILFILALVRRIEYAGYLLAASTMNLIAGVVYATLNLGVFDGIPGVYNYGFITVIGMALQNTVSAAIIVIRMEDRRVSEQLARKQAEATLVAQSEQIIMADRMTGLATRVSVVSHEVATPLGGTRLLATQSAALVEEIRTAYRKGDMTREEFEKFLDDMAESGNLINKALVQALGIISGFRVIAAEEASLSSRSIDIRKFLADFHQITEPLVKRTPHKLVLEEIECRRTIRTIPGYLSQVLSNLINNALKHAFPENRKGSIHLQVHDGKDGEIIIDVSDDGRGISADLREQIFVMHFTTAGHDGGTGLGLAISRRLAEDKLNGNLELIAPEGGGSLFRLVLRDLVEY